MKDICKGFYHFGGSYYAANNRASMGGDFIDEVMVGDYPPGGGTTDTNGEFAVRWFLLGGKPTFRLEAFSDSLGSVALMPEVVAWLRDHRGTDAARFCEALRGMGYADRTDREGPARPKDKVPTVRDSLEVLLRVLAEGDTRNLARARQGAYEALANN